VSRLNSALKKLGAITWFDEDRMEGNIIDQKCAGIDDSKFVIVCITQTYIDKVRQTENSNDNCKQEFLYAKRKGAEKMFPIVMEPACFKQSAWKGAVGMTLGSTLYLTLTGDNDVEEVAVKLILKLQ
jgi:hypothetical protein